MENTVKEQVWESEGTIRPESPEKEETFESQDIVKIHVDLDEAKKKFNGRILNADYVNFADPFTKARNRGYGSGSYVLEVVGSDLISSGESIDQKFNRLYYEIIELRDEVEKAKEENTEDYRNSISKDKIYLLTDMIKKVSLMNETNNEDKKEEEIVINSIKDDKENGITINKDVYIASLEHKLAELEKKIGTRTTKNESSTVLDTLEDLKIRVDSLSMNNYGIIEKKWRDMSTTVSSHADKVYSDPHNEFVNIEKINNLYELSGRWDATCQNLPLIVKRLQSLSGLHEQAEKFCDKLNSLDDVQKNLVNDINVEKHNLEDFNIKFSLMIKNMNDKLDTVCKQLNIER